MNFLKNTFLNPNNAVGRNVANNLLNNPNLKGFRDDVINTATNQAVNYGINYANQAVNQFNSRINGTTPAQSQFDYNMNGQQYSNGQQGENDCCCC